MKPRAVLLALGLGLTLTACGAPQQPTKALPPEFVEAAMESALAETIADNCRFYRYNEARERQMIFSYSQRLSRAGYTNRDLDANMRQMRRDGTMERMAVQMVLARNIDPASERSWCAAGKREKARGTNIGRYLI